MKKLISYCLLSASIVFLANCGNTGVDPVVDATDEDAIYNIIRYDNPRTFNIDFLNMPVPDTSDLLAGTPYQPLHFWRTVTWDSLFIGIGRPDTTLEDSSRIIVVRTVDVKQMFRGNLEIIALDTAGGSQIVRLSKHYSAEGNIPATFKKYGFDYNTRRGWLLTSIGNTIYGNQLGQVRIWPADHPDSVISVGTREYSLSQFPVFTTGESLIVSVTVPDSNDKVSIKYPSQGGFTWQNLVYNESGNFEGGFSFVQIAGDKHVLVDIIGSQVLQQDTVAYHPSAIGILYNVRQAN
jgi:hypothetical protein